MLEFPCENCGALIQVRDDQRGQLVVCINCNTRQVVPADSMPAMESHEALKTLEPGAGRIPRHPAPPPYTLIEIGGWILTILGLLGTLIFVILSLTGLPESLILLAQAAMFIVTAATGQALLAIRDIAQSAWHLRPKNP